MCLCILIKFERNQIGFFEHLQRCYIFMLDSRNGFADSVVTILKFFFYIFSNRNNIATRSELKMFIKKILRNRRTRMNILIIVGVFLFTKVQSPDDSKN